MTNVKVTSVKVKATKVPDDFPALPTKKTKKNNQQTTFTATISFASIAGIVLPAKNKNNNIENWTNLLTNTNQKTNTTYSSFDEDIDDYDYQSDGSTFDKEFLEEIYLTDDEKNSFV